jgi:regulator of sirC expression with transglutaminase-like and TPR domain
VIPRSGHSPHAGLRDQASDTLAAIGASPEMPFDIGEAALALAALDRPRVALDRYRTHLRDLAKAVSHRANGNTSADGQAAALASVIAGTEGYRGDDETYDDLQNANLISVIDRRRGLPVALGIIYLHTARAQGWRASGLAFPGHFLIGLDAGAERVIFDPFAGRPVESAATLRAMLKATAGNEAELTPACYAPLGDRHVLARLQNNIKTRLAAQGRFAEAIRISESMLLIVPEETVLHRDLGIFHTEMGNLNAAIGALDTFINLTTDEEARHITEALVQKIKTRLN